jgi:predicted dienelactone hydrolase
MSLSASRPALLVASALLAACRTVTPGIDQWTRPGSHRAVVEELGPDGAYVVFRPAHPSPAARFPVVVFSVGTGGSPSAYAALLRHWASHGLVVVAGDSGMQRQGDQAIAALDWLLREAARPGSTLYEHIDGEHVAAAGHSQGGNAALHVAIRDRRITSVLALEPGKGQLGGVVAADERSLAVPVFYVCGAEDRIVPPARCATRFRNTTAPAWVGIIREANHFAPVGDTSGEDQIDLRRWTTRWLLAGLRGDRDARAGFEGDDWTLARDRAWSGVRRKQPTTDLRRAP